MNLILFSAEETQRPLSLDDPRAEHIVQVLRRQPGDSFDVGLPDGPRGKATLTSRSASGLVLTFTWGELPPPLPEIHLLVGLPRPQTARKILQEVATLGVASLHFFAAEKGEASYAQSSLWSSGEWHRLVKAGVEQAFCTRFPKVSWQRPLAELVAERRDGARLALDNYEATTSLAAAVTPPPLTLAFGAERGWSARERDLLRAQGFTLAHLGPRVLRSETAIAVSLGVCLGRR